MCGSGVRTRAIPILVLVAVATSGAALALDGMNKVTIEAPAAVETEATGYLTEVDIGEAAASSTAGPVSITSSAPDLFPVGGTIVHWLATDDAGNRAAAIQPVTVVDTTPPYFPNMPEYVKYETDSPKPAPIHFDLPRAADIADIDVDVSSSHESGQKFSVGNTTVTFTAIDDSGNTATGEVVVMLVDTSPKIQNVKVRPYSTAFHVTWDPMDGHDTYRVVLTETDTGTKVSNLKTALTSYYFTELEPFTKYTVAVSALDDRNTKVTVNTSTRFAEASILDRFETIDRWEHKENSYTSTYVFRQDRDVGNPAPSGVVSGTGYRLSPVISTYVDLTSYKDGDLFVGIDYKTDYVRPFEVNMRIVEMENSNGHDLRYITELSPYESSDDGWKSFSANVTSQLADVRLAKISVYFPDRDYSTDKQTVYYDNFRLFTVPRDG